MKTTPRSTRLAYLLASLSLSACGAAVVPAGGDAGTSTDSAASTDVVAPQDLPITLPVDVVTPRVDVVTPRVDVVTPRVDVVTPRVDVVVPGADASASQVEGLCARACDLQEQQCGTASQSCRPGCTEIIRADGFARCSQQVIAALECLLRAGFVCREGDGEIPEACQGRFSDVQRCMSGSGGDPTPVPLDAGAPDV